MPIEPIICAILFVLFIFGWRFGSYLQNLIKNQNIYRKIGWIVEKENRNMCYDSKWGSLRDEELSSYIFSTQKEVNLHPNFFIDYSNETEKKELEILLNEYKAYIIKSYFHGSLSDNKNICRLTSLEYFMFSLHNYLKKQTSLNSTSLRDAIYTFDRSDSPYSYYKLSEFGKICYKLYLISLLFVEKNEKTRRLFEYIDPKLKNNIMVYLTNNEVSFC